MPLSNQDNMPNPDNKGESTSPNAHAESELPKDDDNPVVDESDSMPREIGGRNGPDPTRFGDWEKAGRCIDF
jgi:hypothetical protein